MSFETMVQGNVILLRWMIPDIKDAPLIIKAVRDNSIAQGLKLIYVAVAPSDSPPPRDDLRKAMSDNVAAMLEYCQSVHLVFEGSGFGQTIKRAALASVVLVSGMRGRMFVYDSIDSLSKSAPAAERLNLARVLNLAIRKGFFEAVTFAQAIPSSP
jgi:hypothetical protein